MKFSGCVFLVVFVLFSAANAQALLVQGTFSGSIDYQRTPFSDVQLDANAGFAGQFVYDTDARVTNSFGNSMASLEGISAFKDLSFTLFDDDESYSYSFSDRVSFPSVTVSFGSGGHYQIDFDGLPGRTNFIGGSDLSVGELILDFDNTFVADINSPLIMPNANDFNPGASFSGSVLYLWVGNTQLNGNIASLKLAPPPVPEPATVALLAGGLVCLVGYRRFRKD